MKSRLSMVLVSLALGAAPLAAQTPFQEYFKLQGLYPNDPTMFIATGSSSGFWAYSSPYKGGLAPLTSPTSFADIMLWCVDETHNAYIGQTYEAWITPLSATDFSHTRLSGGEKTEYEWAAYLAENMNLNWAVTAAQQQTVALQDAMWAILGQGYNTAGRLNTFETGPYAAGLGITTSTNFGVAPGSFFDPTQWALVTCDPGPNNPVSSCAGQEFLIELPGTVTTTVTPEPATLSLLGTGLAGVMGMGLRRRKKRTA